MTLRTVSLAVVVVLALQGCTKTVYYAVLAPHATMDDGKGCFRQCQMLHAGQTKQFLQCVETCPESRIVKAKRCEEVTYDAEAFGCVTAHNQTFDGLSFGIGLGILVLLNVIIFAIVAGSNSSQAVK